MKENECEESLAFTQSIQTFYALFTLYRIQGAYTTAERLQVDYKMRRGAPRPPCAPPILGEGGEEREGVWEGGVYGDGGPRGLRA
jgi:hypothetical protein